MLIAFSYIADKIKSVYGKQRQLICENMEDHPFIEYTAHEIYKELLLEK